MGRVSGRGGVGAAQGCTLRYQPTDQFASSSPREEVVHVPAGVACEPQRDVTVRVERECNGAVAEHILNDFWMNAMP